MLLTAIRTGFIKALKTAAALLKIVLPVFAVVVVIRHSPVMPFLQDLFAPAMKFFGLPGEAIIPIITGIFTDEYGTIAVMNPLALGSTEITTVAMIVLVAHTIPVEGAIAQKIGLNVARFTAYRLAMAIVVGLLTGWLGGVFAW